MTSYINRFIFCDMGHTGADALKPELQRRVPDLIFAPRPSVQIPIAPREADTESVEPRDKYIVVVNNPIVRNLRFFTARAADHSEDQGKDTHVDRFINGVALRGAQHWFSKEVVQFLGVNYEKFERIEPGAASVSCEKGEVLVLAMELPLDSITRLISDFLEVDVSFEESAEQFSQNESALFEEIKAVGLPISYVSEILNMPFVRHLYDSAQIRQMRCSWEDSAPARRMRKDVSFEDFGNEIPSRIPKAPPGMRVYEAEGTFFHKAKRKNIAVSKFWCAEPSHPEDFRDFERRGEHKKYNYMNWKRGNLDAISGVAFRPKMDVAIHDITIELVDLPIEKYPFLLGDGCVYFDEISESDNIRRIFPGPAEAHCTAMSISNSSNFVRHVGFPSDLPLYVSENEWITTPQHFARHWPHEISEEDLETARVKVSISYKPYEKSQKVHKFIRIPYLDQYPKSPVMIQENRPWYKAWDEAEPLVVRGYSVYFSPKPPIRQQLEDLKIFVQDRDGNPVPGKELKMNDQIAGNGEESFSLNPSFVRGDLVVENGETLSASGYLVDGTPAADMAFYVLVEIPDSRIDAAYGNPLYYSQGCANLDYLRNQYDQDRVDFNSTPAAISILDFIGESSLSPWFENVGSRTKSVDGNEKGSMRSLAAGYIFVD